MIKEYVYYYILSVDNKAPLNLRITHGAKQINLFYLLTYF